MKKIIKQYPKKNITVEELNLPSTKIDITKVQTGIVFARKCDMEKSDDTSYEENPVYFYVIKHPDHGNFVIDAGLDSSFANQEYGSQKGLIKKKVGCKCSLSAHNDFNSYLKQNSISIEKAFLSHMHFDHIAGLIDAKDITTCVCSASEKYNRFNPFYYGNQLKNIETMECLDFKSSGKLDDSFSAIDYFGDLSLIILSTSGHTKGHISFLINSQEGIEFVASDAYVYNRESLRENGCGKFAKDINQATSTLNSIVEFLEKHDGIKLFTGH